MNAAARLESLAEAGGVSISESAYDQVKTKVSLEWEAMGERTLKNIAEHVRVYRLRRPEKNPESDPYVGRPGRLRAAVGTPSSSVNRCSAIQQFER